MTDIFDFFSKRTSLYKKLTSNAVLRDQIICAGRVMEKTLARSNKILIFGNGGSAAQAQHFAAELVCQFEKKRRALAAIALTTDSSIITAQSNDSSFDEIFSRQIEAIGRKGDIVIGLTTSDARAGNPHSRNILNGFLAAKRIGAAAVGLFSDKTDKMPKLVDVAVIIPSKNTAIIQEAHQAVIHLLCSLVEEKL